MIIERLPEPLEALLIRDTFTFSEAESILSEVSKVEFSEDDTSVRAPVPEDPRHSQIYASTLDNFFSQNVLEALLDVNQSYCIYTSVNNHKTFINRIEHGNDSPMRQTAGAFTIMTFLWREPKAFEGGTVTLQVSDTAAYEKDIENNMTLIFPSAYYNSISKIVGEGLVVLESFLYIESK